MNKQIKEQETIKTLEQEITRLREKLKIHFLVELSFVVLILINQFNK